MMRVLGIQQCPRFAGEAVRGRSRGISKYEFLIRVAVVAVLATILLERFLYYQEYAEKVVMESTVLNIRSGMRLRIAELMTTDRTKEIGTLLKENPISWLERPPVNYLGVFEGAAPEEGGDGWYFDTLSRELVYRPRLHRFFTGSPTNPTNIHFRVVGKGMAGSNKNGTSARIEGLEVVTVGQYKWF